MSAYVVDEETINRIVAGIDYANEYGDGYNRYPRLPRNFFVQLSIGEDETGTWKERIHRILLDLNCDAVKYRYEDAEKAGMIPDDYSFTSVAPPTALQLYKTIRCWLYQCSEGQVPGTPVYKLFDEWSHDIAEYLVCKMPEYETANWG